jgi:hypothetical protein
MLAIPFSVTFLALTLNPRRDDYDSPSNECAGKTHDKDRRYVPHCRLGGKGICAEASSVRNWSTK